MENLNNKFFKKIIILLKEDKISIKRVEYSNASHLYSGNFLIITEKIIDGSFDTNIHNLNDVFKFKIEIK